MSQDVFQCYRCQGSLTADLFYREDRCPKCGFDTRVCKNCVYFDEGAYNQCRESQADRVVDKEKGNFCDYFRPGRSVNATQAVDALSAAEALFRKK